MYTLTEETKKNILATFSKNMMSYRKSMRASQDEFGSMIGITRQTVSSIERGMYPLTWSIFLSSLFICSGNQQTRQLILNTFAGDTTVSNYLEGLMGQGGTHGSYDFSEGARQVDFAACVITDEEGFPIVEYDERTADFLHIKGEKAPSLLSFVYEDDRSIVEHILKEKIRKQIFVCAEFRIKTSESDYVSVHCLIKRQKKLMKDGRFDMVLTQLSGEALRKHTVTGMMDQIPVGIIAYEIDNVDDKRVTDIYYANSAFYDVIGHTKEQFASIHNNIFNNIVASDDVRRANKIFAARDTRQISQIDIRINTFEGNARWVHCSSAMLICDEDGSGIIALALTNITNRVNSELTMKYQLDRYRQLDEVSDDVQFNYELNEDRFSVPIKFGKFQNSDNVIKHFIAENKARDYVHPEDYELYKNQASTALALGGKSTSEYRIKIDGDNYNWCRIIINCVVDEQGTISYIYGRILVIDEEKRIQKEHKDDRMLINRLSSTDRLTGLFNRTAFRGRVQEIIKTETEGVNAIIYMDINNFSFINEKYGYPAGDRLLRDFAQMFLRKGKKCFGCRTHSDFFLVYINDKDKRIILSKINNWAKVFIEHQTKSYPGIDIRISAGVYFIPIGTSDITQAIDNANMARKQIKKNKLKNICIFTQALKERRDYEQMIVGEVTDAIKEGRIEVFFQPKFSITDRKVIGAEALARWRNDDGTYKNASDFVPILEESGKITDLDFCIYTKVLLTLRKWIKAGKPIRPVSINFSDRHNSYQNFDDKIIRLAEQYDVPPEFIEIEIKENILASNIDNISERVEVLQRKGFRVTLDSFGSGSSLGFLLNAPVDSVKVDKTIWNNMEHSEKESNFVHALYDLIAAAKKDVVFEGVETEEQAGLLYEAGFTAAQGYLFAKPMSIEAFESQYLS